MKQTLSGFFCIIIVGVILTGCITEQPKQQPENKPLPDIAEEVVNLLVENNFTGVYRYFDTSVTSRITIDDFATMWQQQIITPNGNITQIVQTRQANESGYAVVYVTCIFSKAQMLDVKISFNTEHTIVGLIVVPTEEGYHYSPPSYVNQSLFTEQNVSIGQEPWVLPGTLTIPTGNGPFPAVLLVHGSGPNDRDETYGPNKPFKDLAWGLASQGIVVLRYEKRTKQYPEESAAIHNFTVEDETITDAIAGMDFLNSSPIVNHSSMFVLGHSLGGMLAPRLALQDHRISGLILLAGPTRHLEDLILEQSRYLVNLSGLNQSAQLVTLERLVIKIKTLEINESEYVLGAPKSYWVDLATYDPVKTAQSLDIPLLILQGMRDYQVTMTDFAHWNATFSGKQSVTLKTYPTLNHFFIAGTGTPTDAEYLIEGHVDEHVIVDIASWVSQQ